MKKIFKFKKAFFMLAIVYVCFILISQQVTMKRQKIELEIQTKEKQEAVEESQLLQDKMKMAESDNNKYVQRLAREKLGFVKDGEVVIIDNSEDNKVQNNDENQRNNKDEKKREQ